MGNLAGIGKPGTVLAAGRHLDRVSPDRHGLVDLGVVNHEGGDHSRHVVARPAREQEEIALGGRAPTAARRLGGG
jgi:hypothetical protein